MISDHFFMVGQNYASGFYEVECSCGWKPREQFTTEPAAVDAWEDHWLESEEPNPGSLPICWTCEGEVPPEQGRVKDGWFVHHLCPTPTTEVPEMRAELGFIPPEDRVPDIFGEGQVCCPCGGSWVALTASTPPGATMSMRCPTCGNWLESAASLETGEGDL